eukprot:1097086-Amphidinium_carterae.1
MLICLRGTPDLQSMQQGERVTGYSHSEVGRCIVHPGQLPDASMSPLLLGGKELWTIKWLAFDGAACGN